MDKSIERVERAIEAIARGEMVILVDDEDRENEGDLVMAADRVTPEAINFMATHARGLICLTMTGSRLDALQIPMMVTKNSSCRMLMSNSCMYHRQKCNTCKNVSHVAKMTFVSQVLILVYAN